MNIEEQKLELLKLENILQEFADERTSSSGQDYYFGFSEIPKTESIEQTYGHHLQSGIFEQRATDIFLDKLDKNSFDLLELSECLCEWLFGQTDCTSYRQRANELLDTMIHLSQATNLWKADYFPPRLCAGSWDDFLFESEKQVFMLHLGCSD